MVSLVFCFSRGIRSRENESNSRGRNSMLICQLLSRRDMLCQSNHKYFQAHALIISYIMFYICILLCKFDSF